MATTDKKKWISDVFQEYEASLNGHSNHPIVNYRRSGFELFNAADIPTRRIEDWKYTSVARIFNDNYKISPKTTITQSDVDQYSIPELDVYKIVYVNGHLDTSKSELDDIPSGLQVLQLSDALKDDNLSSWINELTKKTASSTQNTFLALNQALAANGLVVVVEKNVIIDKPLHIIHINTETESPYITSPQLFVKGEISSQVTIIESHHGTNHSATYFSNITVRAVLAANSNMSHYKIQLDSKSAYQVSNTMVYQDRDSVFSSYVVDIGGAMVRNNLSSELGGTGIESNFYGVYLGCESQHIDNQTFVDHAQPHCDSNELYKGILTDKSRGVFNGKVMVRQDAQKTNAFQQNNSLILSAMAIMDAKPQLEIYADDVKCSHGATIGQLDEPSLFYLKSRGISENDARNLLKKAFVGEVILHIKNEAIRNYIFGMVDRKLGMMNQDI